MSGYFYTTSLSLSLFKILSLEKPSKIKGGEFVRLLEMCVRGANDGVAKKRDPLCGFVAQ